MSKLFEYVAIIYFLVLVNPQDIQSNNKTTATEDNAVTLKTTKSTNTEDNASDHVTNLNNMVETLSTSQQAPSAYNAETKNTDEDEDLTGTTNPSSADTSSTNQHILSSNVATKNTDEDEDLIATTNPSSAASSSANKNISSMSNTAVNNTDEDEDLSSTNPSSIDTSTMETEEIFNVSLSSDISTPEDFGTVIESDEDTNNTSTTFEEAVTETENGIIVNGTNRTTTREPYKQQTVADGLRDIAYYLRAYKFNEYDRRYETNANTAPRVYFKGFPRPPLRSLHWEVRKHCEPTFSGCVEYLRKKVRHISLKRTDDTAVVMQEQNWTLTNHSEQIKQIDEECKKLRKVGNILAEPFEGPLERFQWRVTASYYMCWYTMQEVLELKHFSEPCDNFADCLDEELGPNNRDVRANDSDPYACALYSFCPNPCCPIKHLTKFEDCWDSTKNPCFIGNVASKRDCAFSRPNNTEFRDIVLNRWNVTCRCPSGYEWNSRFGMCIDLNECDSGGHNCDRKLHQGCVNLAGSFRCACVWGHIWNTTKNQCIASEALRHLKLSHKKDSENSDEKSESLIRKLTKFFRKSAANTSRFDKIALLPNLLCVLLCLF